MTPATTSKTHCTRIVSIHKEKPVMKYKVRCTKCNWKGEEQDLVYFTDGELPPNDGRFLGCPNCKTDECLIEYTPGGLLLDFILRAKTHCTQ